MFSIFRLPYYDRSSMKFAKRISKIISDKFNISIRVVYSTYKVKNYFQLKCRTPLPLLSKVVYRFTCVQDTHISYIGYTKRHMATRVTEHTDPKYAKKSHVFGHIKACSACSAANTLILAILKLLKCAETLLIASFLKHSLSRNRSLVKTNSCLLMVLPLF